MTLSTLTVNATITQQYGTWVHVPALRVFICGKCGHQFWVPTVIDARFVPRHECPSAACMAWGMR